MSSQQMQFSVLFVVRTGLVLGWARGISTSILLHMMLAADCIGRSRGRGWGFDGLGVGCIESGVHMLNRKETAFGRCTAGAGIEESN